MAYGGYQLGKLSSRFSGYGGGYGYGGHQYGFNDWNRWREIDGFMCRDSNDCNWIDRNLYCQDYELDFQPSVSFMPVATGQQVYERVLKGWFYR